ncbi:hypothetical protein pipiens_006640 [Culex pipiens pipiens]|uniref:RRM domain-containing protein n=1 Tax=Culex pipiens pipiens TaxID=38569 RepID=A0ABD1DP54_CULPP
MESTIVHITNFDLLSLDASDLVYLFGQYVDVLGVDASSTYANVQVQSPEQAQHAIYKLDGRYIQCPDGLLVPMRLSLNLSASASKWITNLPPARIRPDLEQPLWKFYVSNFNKTADFNAILNLFRPFGTLCWSSRDGSGTHGSVIVKTCSHWKQILEALHGSTLAGHQLKIIFDRKIAFTARFKEDLGKEPDLRIAQLTIRNLSRADGQKYEAELRSRFQRWGQVTWMAFGTRRKFCALHLMSRYTADEVLRQMGPLVIRGCKLVVEVGDETEDLSMLPLDVSDLVYLFGTYVDVLDIDFKPKFANVVVPTLSEAARAIHELDGRVLQHPNGDLVQMQLFLKKQSPARQPTKKLPPARFRPDLAPPIWKFYVSNLGTNTDFNVVLDLFRPYGAIVWSSRDASGTYGSVMVKTSTHWTIVTDTLRGTTLAGNRLYVTIDRKHLFATCYKGVAVSIPTPLAKGFRMMQILIGGLSRKGWKYEAELRCHFQRWGQVVRISFNTQRKICCLHLKSRYSADEILRQAGPVVTRGRRLDVAIPVEDEIEDVTTVIVEICYL